ncbi:FecCD family ABC transporter permease [Candidatus Enterococcus ferrettii]|uniref:Iron complex transport system permease n=1 Tax=Candidatus Enterococcus ferrettii TaxID=2815324 RepID=A0ABV0EYX7_9ENTE|nr:iron ABC transporter permease [Enterococcus sp. 665A]MBO1339938.1 iron ABC transporter permease [Enterococcus sp. 665A]
MKRSVFFILTSLLLLLAMIASLKYGAVSITWQEIGNSFTSFDISEQGQQLVRTLRLPRMLGSVLVGAGFATAGALMQGITNNPIADSGLLGINAGAGLGLALVFAVTASPSPLLAIIASFFGAFVALIIIYIASSKLSIGFNPIRIVLLGAALSAFFSAISQSISLVFHLNQDLTFWYVGGTANISWQQLHWAFPLVLIGLLGTIFLAPQVTLLSMGDETAITLGKKPATIRKWSMTLVLLLAGTSVSLVGAVSFVGLIVPHVVRYFVGQDYRMVLPASALIGSLFFVIADIASRLIAPPLETPVGVLVTIIGVPLLLLQIRRGSVT